MVHRFSIDEMCMYLQNFNLRINCLQAHFEILVFMHHMYVCMYMLLEQNMPRVTVHPKCTGEMIHFTIKIINTSGALQFNSVMCHARAKLCKPINPLNSFVYHHLGY